MRTEAILTVLDGVVPEARRKDNGQPPFFLRTDEMTSCLGTLTQLTPTRNQHRCPLTLDPLQVPPIF